MARRLRVYIRESRMTGPDNSACHSKRWCNVAHDSVVGRNQDFRMTLEYYYACEIGCM